MLDLQKMAQKKENLKPKMKTFKMAKSQDDWYTVHKKWIVEANSYKEWDFSKDFDWSFIDSLTERIEGKNEGKKALSPRQFSALKKVVFKLRYMRDNKEEK